MPVWLAPALAAGASLLGNVFSSRSNAKSVEKSNQMSSEDFQRSLLQNESQFRRSMRFARGEADTTREYNRLEAKKARRFTSREADQARDFLANQQWRDRELQKKFAKKSTGWQFDDLMEAADEAGIHRLAAIGGASAASYSPVAGTVGAGGAAAATGIPGTVAGGGGSPSAPAYEAALGGSIVGDGMNAVADLITTQSQLERQQEYEQKMDAERAEERAREDMMMAMQMELMGAEAEMYRARARTAIATAATGAPPSAFTNVADPGQQEMELSYNIGRKDNKKEWLVGPDLGEFAGGALVAFGNEVRDRWNQDKQTFSNWKKRFDAWRKDPRGRPPQRKDRRGRNVAR